MPKSVHYASMAIAILSCAPLIVFSATYYDCIKQDRSITYRAEPCLKGEQESRHYSVDLSIYNSSNKESVGKTDPNPIDVYPTNNGIYHVPGSINGHSVLFVVDTGASNLSLSKQEAAAYGITGCMPSKSTTANGLVDTCIAIASKVTFGGFSLSNVPVAVMPNLVGNPLLGMNILSQFKMEQKNGVMRISKHGNH